MNVKKRYFLKNHDARLFFVIKQMFIQFWN
jgi:hypothetical protein